jgi:hypothetical protein
MLAHGLAGHPEYVAAQAAAQRARIPWGAFIQLLTGPDALLVLKYIPQVAALFAGGTLNPVALVALLQSAGPDAQKIITDILAIFQGGAGGVVPSPQHLGVSVGYVPGGNVTLTFSWDPASDGGATDHYTLQIAGMPAWTLPGTASSYAVTVSDSTSATNATLTAWNKDNKPCPLPAIVTFVPHTNPPAPIPSNPANFGVVVS